MIGAGLPPTRTAALELREELGLVREAYEFLDEKRLLLAAELLRQLADYEQLAAQLQTQGASARRALGEALARHGLQGLSVYPAVALEQFVLRVQRHDFMGVALARTAIGPGDGAEAGPPAACNPSSEARDCRAAFRDLLESSARLAGLSGNLHRLAAEYRLTERRARALENVILPEIEQALSALTAHLEGQELEEAVRVRLAPATGQNGVPVPGLRQQPAENRP